MLLSSNHLSDNILSEIFNKFCYSRLITLWNRSLLIIIYFLHKYTNKISSELLFQNEDQI